MVTLLDIAGQEIKEASERLEKTSTAEHAAALAQSLPNLAERIRSGTVTVQDIDSFLKSLPRVQPEIKAYLLSKKGYLLFQEGKQEQGLRSYDYALATKENPSTWAVKGTALLQMDRIEDALLAFQKAYELRDDFGPQKQEYLKDLFSAWGATVFFLGLDAVLGQNIREFRKRVEEYIDIQEKAQGEGLEGIPGKVVFREPGYETPDAEPVEPEHTLVIYAREAELKDAVEELTLAIRLMSIKDPFERFKALSIEVTKVWPEGVSAVDAIREQRDREWTT